MILILTLWLVFIAIPICFYFLTELPEMTIVDSFEDKKWPISRKFGTEMFQRS